MPATEKYAFKNRTAKPQFVNLELSASRFRVDPGEELILLSDPVDPRNERGCALSVELILNGRATELVVWTAATQMFHSDGRPAAQCFDSAGD
jgi:hypothetical protein